MYGLEQQLGYSDHGLGKWVIAFAVIVIALLAIGMFL